MTQRVSLCIATLGILAAVAHADTPALRTPTNIYDGAAALAVTYYATPFVVDWNTDGKKDLVVGQQSGAKIRRYLNQGADANPVFSGFSYLQAGGSDIVLPGG